MAKGRKTGGRKKGSSNRLTVSAREAVSQFIENNAPRLQKWLEAVEKADGPKAAALLYRDFAEFHLPKLARTEISSPDGSALSLTIQLSK